MNIIIPKNTLIKKTISHMMNDYTNVTGIACVFVDINGKERSDKYNFSPFCQLMRSIPAFREKCKQCDRYGGLDALKNSTCMPYRCHAGLVDYSIPIIHESQLAGFVVSGQMRSEDVRIPCLQKRTTWEKDGRIESYFRRIEQFQYDDIMSAARILESLISTCFPFNEAKPHIKTIMDELRFKNNTELATIKRPEIKKTVDYIHRHLGSELTLRTISEKVYLSEYYLSKLFKQEMNMNLMQYINQCRIEEAKRLLQSSNLSVEAIGRQLGYRRTSYFCKMFKSFTSVTPHAYRKKFEIR